MPLLLIGSSELRSSGESHNQTRRERAGSQAAFLSTAPLQRLQFDSFPDHQGADALGTVELVGTEADEVQSERIRLQGDVAQGLGGIAVQANATLTADRRQFSQGLNHSDLVIGRHHADQSGLRGDRLLQLLGGDQPIGAWGQQGHPEALAPQLLQRVEHSVVLRGHADQMTGSHGPGMAEQRQVVGFRGTAGEHDALRRQAQALRQLTPRQVDRG